MEIWRRLLLVIAFVLWYLISKLSLRFCLMCFIEIRRRLLLVTAFVVLPLISKLSLCFCLIRFRLTAVLSCRKRCFFTSVWTWFNYLYPLCRKILALIDFRIQVFSFLPMQFHQINVSFFFTSFLANSFLLFFF